MKTMPFQLGGRGKKGQIIVVYAMLFPILFFFLGLGIDVGLIYLSNAKLSRAIDASALRMARKFETSASRRQQIATEVMKTNYPGFFTSTPTWTVTGSIASEEVMTGTGSNGQSVTITTKADALTGVITVKMGASVRHSTFFMPLAGENYRTVSFSGNATAERYPACNVLILDNSGSMTGNGGSTNMAPAVKAFVEEFDETRDYLLIVGFGYQAFVLWPPPGEGVDNGYVRPGHGFKTGSGGGETYTMSAKTMVNSLKFNGNTNAADGIRLAGYHTDRFYQSLTDIAKSKIKFNYVFMTDGQFNSAPTYAQGYGFGFSDIRYKYESSRYTKVSSGTAKGATVIASNLPAFHWIRPVYGGGADSTTGVIDASKEYMLKGADFVFKWYDKTGNTLRGSWDLVTYMKNLNLSTTPCVAVNIMTNTGPPGTDNLYTAYTLVKSTEIPSESGTRNDTVKKYANYDSGKKWTTGWGSGTARMSYFYPDYTFPAEVTYVDATWTLGNTYNVDKVQTSNQWTQWYSYPEQAWKTSKIDAQTGTNDVTNWTALAQIAYLRELHNATVYSVGFDDADEEIMRNLANQDSGGGTMTASANLGKYYRVNSATDMSSTFREVARQIAVRLSE